MNNHPCNSNWPIVQICVKVFLANIEVPDYDSEAEDEVMSAWAEVASLVSDELGRSISLLRIDSIVAEWTDYRKARTESRSGSKRAYRAF